jgi:hypothetical protein
MNIINRLADRLGKIPSLPEGVYHRQDMQDNKPYRVHLRLRPDGSGILILNASTVLQLNATAAEYAYHFIHGTDPGEAARQMAARYRVSREIAHQDFQDFLGKIETLISTPDLDPISVLELERAAPHSADLLAPLRLDCALTYRLRPDSKAEYAPTKHAERELTSEEWGTILDKAWQAGIPHITFTGGEATLREDLPELIAHAEKNGQVCGLLTDGLRLLEPEYLHLLLQTGLDHILFLLQPGDETSWAALEKVIAEDIFVTVHLTLNPDNIGRAEEILARLAALQVTSLSLTSADDSLRGTFDILRDRAAALGLTLKFDLPVPYSSSNPVVYETAEYTVPEGAGKAWLYVEPDGDVLPAQGSSANVLGNLLRDAWQQIYM